MTVPSRSAIESEFSRYRDVVPDYDEFVEALSRPLPLTARVNRLKASREEVVDELRRVDVEVREMEWFDDGVHVDSEVKLGNTLPHYLGWIHVQEEVSMIPAVVLDADGGDRVLDACAAPGSKATQVAVDAGYVHANDVDGGRVPALRSNCDRLGVTNVAVTRQDARSLETEVEFDGALVDAPCSGEGTTRKTDAGAASEHEATSLQGVQKGILSRAVELTRSGGVVVYSTCTFAPEENEAVVSHVLDDVEVE
ncbi:MAG: RsmB/NOP family class I SAM-dependent RNA methyltransferase, partial [Halobacteriota archaeon]